MGTLLHYVKKLKRKKAFFFKTLAVSNVIPTEKKRRRGGKKGPGSENIMSQLWFTCTGTRQHVNSHVKNITYSTFCLKKEKKKVTKKTLKSD